MATADRGFAATMEQAEMALAAMHTGNSEPYIASWVKAEDVTLFGA